MQSTSRMKVVAEEVEPATGATARTDRSSPGPLADSIDDWMKLRGRVAGLLREAGGADWPARVGAAVDSLRTLAERDVDVALYVLIQAGVSGLEHYSAHHAMLCAVVGEVCGHWFDWPDDELRSLAAAALTMNVAMASSQDALARQVTPLTSSQRREIDGHAEAGALLLTAAGVTDPLWIEIVRRHDCDDLPTQGASRGELLTRLLRRVDIYTAKLSSRGTRRATSPAIAARDACLDARGLPDAIGATMLRSMGLYPPGTYVRLASGETAIVVRRGQKAHAPIVASLQRADGSTFLRPTLRDTSEAAHAVTLGLSDRDVRVRVNHARVLAAKDE